MIFRPCLVVPVYNPGPTLGRALDGLLACGHPLFVHDDGSDEATRLELEDAAAVHPDLRLSRWPENRGKGAAVVEGFRRAQAEGFTHALQVDADGQHDVGAIAAFLALGEARPEAVIAGVPVYDTSVPAARKYGRWFTHAWVWLETLSFDIGDSLCGFRLYPLEAMARILAHTALPARMDFDTAAIVRLHWAGVPVVNAPVRVVYPVDGVSHFHLIRDNLRLTRLHTLLVLGMLRRLPALAARRLRGNAPRDHQWTKIQERGTALGLRTAHLIFQLTGARGLRWLTEVLAAYFFLTGRAARQASGQYLDRLFRHAGPLPDLPTKPGIRARYRHIRTFALSYVDRFLAWMDASDAELVFPEEQAFQTLIHSGRGALFLSAHLGNLDMLRGLGASRGIPGLNAVIYSEHVIRFQELLGRINPGYTSNLIHVAEAGPETVLLLEERIARGESLFIVGDRPPASENGRTLDIPFLGREAAFPIGPLFLAHLLQCPVYLFFCVKKGGRYHIHMEPFADRVDLPRKRREAALRSWLGRYVQAVEARCRETPFQWFNFYDFWGEARSLPPPPPTAPTA